MNNGGPAFPRLTFFDDKIVGTEDGMSLRDYFAGQALAGRLANHQMYERHGAEKSDVAADAYAYADAMLKARKA